MVMDAGCSLPSSLEPKVLLVALVAMVEATRPVDPALDSGSDLAFLFAFSTSNAARARWATAWHAVSVVLVAVVVGYMWGLGWLWVMLLLII